MDDFISEPIKPVKGTFNASAMATGVPGLPTAFIWRDQAYSVVDVLETWKESAPERGRADGEIYLRRHCARLRMSDGSAWVIYFTRQPQRSGSAKQRWFLYSITQNPDADAE